MPISVEVHDAVHGRPASGVLVRVERVDGREPQLIGSAETNEQGRINPSAWADPGTGSFRLIVDARRYFSLLGVANSHGELSVCCDIRDAREQRHVPIVLSPFGYSAYVGIAI